MKSWKDNKNRHKRAGFFLFFKQFTETAELI